MPPPRTTESRKQAYRRGLRAEWIARQILKLKGYQVIAERYKNAFGEIDIIARQGEFLVLVEVKARPTLRECLECITPAMQGKKIKAAKSLLAYPGELAPYMDDPNLTVRFDMICIVPWRIPKHITNAWQEH